LTQINEPIEIRAPEGVQKPGLPEDIPLIEGAEDISAIGDMVSFSVARSTEDVSEFYTEAFADNGWAAEEAEGALPGLLTFTKDTRTATLMIAEEDGRSNVIIMLAAGE
jgi:hypothetical protein